MDPEKYMFDGKLEIDPNCRIGYVSQFSQLDKPKETTVFEYIGEKYIKLQNEITSICAEMETSSDIDTSLKKYQQAQDEFDAINGDEFESNINKKPRSKLYRSILQQNIKNTHLLYFHNIRSLYFHETKISSETVQSRKQDVF